MNSPIVSVLMTAFNREKYIADAIESVLAQRFEDFELIIVDDCSTDKTHEIALQYAEYRRVKVYRNEKNLGDYPNRNKAASLAKGKYIKYLDSDDMMYPHCLEIMVEHMEAFPDAGFGFSKEPFREWIYPVQLEAVDAYRLHFLGRGVLSDGPSGAIIKKSIFDQIGGFPPERHTSDMACWLQIAAVSKIVFTIDGLIYWRIHPEQEIVRENTSDQIQIEVAARRLRIELAALSSHYCPLDGEELFLARNNCIGIYLRKVLRNVLRVRLRSAWHAWKQSTLTFADSRCIVSPSIWPYRDSPEKLSPHGIGPIYSGFPFARLFSRS